MLAFVYLLFITKHRLFVSAMSIVTHTRLTGNTSLLCSVGHISVFCYLTTQREYCIVTIPN